MINKLKKRFIILAMVSLTVLLSLIVAGMNIINYQTVVSDADRKIDVLEENSDRLLNARGGAYRQPFADMFDDDVFDDLDDLFDDDSPFFGGRDPGGPSMSRDEAEESRFFIVAFNDKSDSCQINIDRISSVDADEAEKMAQTALASGKDSGFIDEFRYSVAEENGSTRILFLDCGRVLESFRSFLKASILMSLAGLLIVFGVICYFAGRIVKPVAESYEKQKRFITDAGHEIKTPLAIIKANIDLMDMELDSASEGASGEPSISDETAYNLRDNLTDINDQVRRLTGLTNDLVYLSRMEEGGSSLVMTDIPLSDIVEETASSFDALAEEKGLAISRSITPMLTMHGSSKEIEKLISIILENAVKYSVSPRQTGCGEDEDGMPAPPMIAFDMKKDGKNAVIEVRNETEGELTNDALSHVFERFYRTDSSRNSATGGHGIGLSMASAIVNAHGGKISARTSTGRDFIVTVTLPLQ